MQILLAKGFQFNKIKEAHKIQTQGGQRKDDVLSVQLSADKKSWEYIATQS